jgi:hypothetical protein
MIPQYNTSIVSKTIPITKAKSRPIRISTLAVPANWGATELGPVAVGDRPILPDPLDDRGELAALGGPDRRR